MTNAQAAKFGEWCQGALGLEDWRIEIVLQDDPPAWVQDDGRSVGACASVRSYKTAHIWVSPQRSRDEGTDQFAVLAHEVLHAAACDTGIESDGRAPTDSNEFLWNRLGDILAAAYKARVKV